ncbi:MAG TPA: urease accessory protein UreD [Steroidobacteraceae bacterium]|jgi:urease accessory protein|nr:urease accessory protein UreD [Steroidobacteraceae bacterium]
MTALKEEAATGWQGLLELRFAADESRTRLAHRLHRGPLMVQRAFYPDGPVCHVYVIHPPGGVVSGDELSLQVEVGPGALALLTTPAAGKFYRRYGACQARLTQVLRVEGGTLEWLPQENICYPNADATLATVVRLQGDCHFFGWEIACFGLPASQLDLGKGRIRQCLELWHDDAALVLERVTIDATATRARWGLAGRVSAGTLLAFPACAAHLEQARDIARSWNQDADLLLACTLIDKTLCCRAYAARADRLKQAFVDLWSGLRMTLLGRAAVAPRIWKT